MKKRIAAMVLLLAMAFTMSASAVEVRRAGKAVLRLSFEGTTAVCSVTCKGNDSRDAVDATLTLYQGNTEVDSWSGSGTGRVAVSGQCGVKSGKEYTLTVTYAVNGTEQPSQSIAKECP